MDTFDDTRKSLLDRYGSAEKATATKKKEEEDSFQSSGNAEFDSLRKQLLSKYSTDRRKPVQNAPDYRKKTTPLPDTYQSTPFSSERAWKEYYDSHASKGQNNALPLPGSTLPKRETAQQEQPEKKGFWERFADDYRKYSGGAGMGEYGGIAAASLNLATDDSWKKPTEDWTEEERKV